MKERVGDVNFHVLVPGVDEADVPVPADAAVIIHGARPVLDLDDEQRCDDEVEAVHFQFILCRGVEDAHGDRIDGPVQHAVIVAKRGNVHIKRARVGLTHVKGEWNTCWSDAPIICNARFDDDVFNKIAVVDEGEIHRLRFPWNDPNLVECAQNHAVLFADISKDVGREIEP